MAPTGRLAVVVVLASLGSGCDVAPPDADARHGPPLRLVAANVGTNRPMPEDGAVRLTFDRFVHPGTVLRQSVRIVDAEGQPATTPRVLYDPLTRTVTLASPAGDGEPWLARDQFYKVRLLVAESPSALDEGLRAVDGAPLARDQALEIGFLVGAPSGRPIREREPDFCGRVLPLLVERCASGACHGEGPRPAAGLSLATADGIRRTALDRAAQGVNRGPTAGEARSDSLRFASDMALVRPFAPGSSYLLYKLLAAGASTSTTATTALTCRSDGQRGDDGEAARSSGDALTPSADELARLAEQLHGSPMPLASAGAPPKLTFEELERVRLWISAGAKTPDCGPCATPRE